MVHIHANPSNGKLEETSECSRKKTESKGCNDKEQLEKMSGAMANNR